MDGTEVTVDLGELFAENYAVKANLEAASTFVGQRDVSRILAAAHDDVELLEFLRIMEGTDSDGAARFSAKVILADLFEGLGVKKLGVPRPARREEHGVVVRHRELEDL